MPISLYEKQREHKETVSKKFMVIQNYFFEDYFETNPEYASSLGLNRYDCNIKNFSDEHYEKEISNYKEYKRKLSIINPYSLTLDEHADFLLLNSIVNQKLVEFESLPDPRTNRPDIYLPINGIFCLLYRTMKDKDRLFAIISRLNKYSEMVAQAKKNLKNPPKIWTENAISQIKCLKQLFNNLTEIPIIKSSLAAHPELSNKLVEANKACKESLLDYERFLTIDLIERSNGSYCVGRQTFDFYLTNNHFLNYTSGALNEFGYDLLNQTVLDLSYLASKIDKTKTYQELLSELDNEILEPDQLLENYKQTTNRLKGYVKDNKIITFPDNEHLEVVETPEFLRNIIPFAAYYCISPYDESNNGQFWVTPVTESDPEKQKQMLSDGHNLNRLPVIVLHESYPGHHLQIMIAKRAVFEGYTSTVRRVTFNTVFCEGWAVYCEQMLSDLGFLSDKQKMMVLKNRLWRAARIIIDTELHTGRWSYDECVSFLMNKVNMTEKSAKAEVLRYTMNPTQPLSYEVGRRLINQIRNKEENRLGQDFSLLKFHDKLLSKGALPIKIIEELVFHQQSEVMK